MRMSSANVVIAAGIVQGRGSSSGVIRSVGGASVTGESSPEHPPGASPSVPVPASFSLSDVPITPRAASSTRSASPLRNHSAHLPSRSILIRSSATTLVPTNTPHTVGNFTGPDPALQSPEVR